MTRDKRSLFRGMSVEDRIRAQIEVDGGGSMSSREELIEAGAQACADFWGDPVPDDLDRDCAVAVVDAVEPLIRADERAKCGERDE